MHLQVAAITGQLTSITTANSEVQPWLQLWAVSIVAESTRATPLEADLEDSPQRARGSACS